MLTDPFPQIHDALQGQRNRRGVYDAPCPNCGKAASKGSHFGYFHDERTGGGWGKCLVCGWRGNLWQLAELLRIETGEYIPPTNPLPRPKPPKLEPVARWRTNPDKLLSMYRNHSQRYELWTQYKPLSRAAVDRWDLGVGRLPFQRDNGEWYLSRSEWLIVPIFEDGALVALRGRNTGTVGPKWISATGSQYALWNVENVEPGAVCWLTENYVDAMWLKQSRPAWSVAAIGGATTWRPDWAAQLAARKPALVVVALDCDLPGNGGGHLREGLIAEWKAAHPGAAIPDANGPKIANSLRRAGVNARLFEWPDTAPGKAGIDWILK